MDTCKKSTWMTAALAGVLGWATPAMAQPHAAPGTAPAIERISLQRFDLPIRMAQLTQNVGNRRHALVGPTPGVGVGSGSEAEESFWACEELSQQHFLGSSGADACSKAYEILLREKFKGSFPDLLRWWNQEKALRHP
jgi:hypothetical protein